MSPIFPHKCIFCHQWGRTDLKKFIDAEIYGGAMYFYHEKCFNEVTNNPEKHGHAMVDFACKAMETREEEKEWLINEEKGYRDKITKLKNYSNNGI